MKIKQIKRNISDTEYTAMNIIATPYGSLVKTYEILNGIDSTPSSFVKKFKKAKLPFLDDEDWLKKTIEAVGYDYENLKGKPVAMCQNDVNTIFCPFIVGKDSGEVVLLPLFKDGHLFASQEKAMANDSYKFIEWES